MKLIMSGVDYKSSCISEREKLSFTSEKIGDICEKILHSDNRIHGCIIISTCNRTEIYISCEPDFNIEPDKTLIKYSGIKDFKGKFYKKENNDLIYYIMELACGLKSQIVGEGQIVTQINNALEISREKGCSDSELNTLFRIAVSAGKYTLTNAKISNIPLSSAYGAVSYIDKIYSNITNKKCVIIGNGKMSKILQKLLIDKGCHVYVTLRSYKHGDNSIYKGCIPISYGERYEYINGCDFVMTVTKSPHYTLTYDRFEKIEKKPDIVIDLAIPRDAEPKIKSLCKCVNIDELGFDTKIDDAALSSVYEIVEKFYEDFIIWKNYKMALPDISYIKEIIKKRIIKSNEIENIDSDNKTELISFSVEKTVDTLLGSMKNIIMPETMEFSKNKIKERARL